MSYEYADRDRDKLTVVGVAGAAYVHAGHGSQEISVRVEAEDAPAVALAILEAAGYEPSDTPAWKTGSPTGVRVVVNILQEHVETLAKKAEREAEDARVDEWRQMVYRMLYHEGTPARWSDFDQDGKELWRGRYKVAREFFQGEE